MEPESRQLNSTDNWSRHLYQQKTQGWTLFTVCGKFHCLVNVKKVGHAGTLDPMATDRSIVEELKHVITASLTRSNERAKRAKAEDFEAEEGEMLFRIHGLLWTYKAPFLPLFDEVFPYLMPMWGKDRTSEEKRIAICVFDDVAEHCGDATFKYYETFQLCWKHEMIQAQTSPRWHPKRRSRIKTESKRRNTKTWQLARAKPPKRRTSLLRILKNNISQIGRCRELIIGSYWIRTVEGLSGIDVKEKMKWLLLKRKKKYNKEMDAAT
ncbi:armadillo-type fold protein [Artemisia annua]|uniref:Armadillo-type fold protein n=1 Tax=Artemisia annua TaxID=35608 RepID=A0A2U1PBB8_ARTAN|nr:armadillo-type fold protein [Artemisia annua]